MTLYEIIKILSKSGIRDAAWEASLLVEHFMSVPRSKILADGRGADYSSAELIDAVQKRASRYPIQYIIGSWEFCGLKFSVNENCLIPRPDTEIIVEEAVRYLPDGGRLLDLCTGSGCIAAAVLSLTKNTEGYAVELYHEAAEIARENLFSLGLEPRCLVIEGDATANLFEVGEKFDVITANPPYITSDEMNDLEAELSWEPHHALTDDGNGLRIIKGIIAVYKDHLAENGVMIIEHGASQADAVRKIAEEYGMKYRCLKDYGKNDRGAVLSNK